MLAITGERLESTGFEIPEDGAEPIMDTVEAFEIRDQAGEITELPQASYAGLGGGSDR